MIGQAAIWLFSEEDSRSPYERAALARESVWGPAPEGWEIRKMEKGKPYCSDAPEQGFSISHSGGLWGCVFWQGPVGLDLQEEQLRADQKLSEAQIRCRKLARRYFHPAEADFVESAAEPEAVLKRFFALWSAKESYVKYTGQGIDDQFGQLRMLPEASEAFGTALAGEGPFSWQAEGCCFVWQRLSGISLCLCTKEPVETSIKKVSE